MVEISKDFLKLIATLIVVLTIFLAIFNSGILQSLFALKTYAEPITLLDHLAAAIETASSCPGDCSLSVRTSGLPYLLDIYKENGNYYASIDASLVEEKSNVKFLPNQEKPVFTKPLVSDCVISEQNLSLTEGLIQDITIEKVLEDDGTCKVFIESTEEYYDFNVSVDPDTLLVLNGTSSTTTVTVSLIGGQISPGPVSLTVTGAPAGVTTTFDKNDAEPTFASTMTVSADTTAAPGTYNLTIVGTSGNLARTASLQIEVSPTLYTFILKSAISILSILNSPLTGVGVNLNGINKHTRFYDVFTSNIIYSMNPGSPYSVNVSDPFADPQSPRPFSHFRDFDCGGNNTGYILDTNANPYSFAIPNDWTLTYSRSMTAFYKVFTQIRNLEYDNVTNTISGNLLDEDFNPIINDTTEYNTCGVQTQVYPNRNVTIEYLDACSNSWQPIGSVTSSLASAPSFYDNFNSGNYNQWTTTPAWNVANGELSNTGIGDEIAQTKWWNYWNGSSGENNNLEVSVNLSSGGNVSIRVFDGINNYYLQTNDSYSNMYLWVNGALEKNVSLTGIIPNQWNIWRIKQNESYMEFYLNNKKIISYNGVPIMGNGRIQLETFNTQAHFDNATIYDGSWSYSLNNIGCNVKKIGAAYISSDWYYNDTSAGIDIDPSTVPCKLTVNTQADVTGEPLPGVEVNVTDGVLNKNYISTTTGPLATAVYFLASSSLPVHTITVNDVFNSRNFSHYFDQDCDPMNIGYWHDTDNNPYSFSICRDKNITVQYKTFTNITDTTGKTDTFDFDGKTIRGKLLNEKGNAIVPSPKNKHNICEDSSINNNNIPVNRNVTLEYFKKDRWYYINSTDSLSNGNWSYDWGCECNATKLRANYTPLYPNWYYMPSSAVIDIVCPCKLTVITQIDIFDPQPYSKLSPVRVNVSNIINWTNASGMIEYELFPGTYYINVDDPFKSRPFSHFFDNDCSQTAIGYYQDNAFNPYTFSIYDRDKTITAQYKAFTNITDTKGKTNTFEYNGTYIKGKLTDEEGNPLLSGPKNKHVKCEDSSINNNNVPVNSNVTLEVYNSSDSKWYLIGTNDSIGGNWSYKWTCTPGATRLRASYIPLPENWYYNYTSTELPIACKGTLDVYAFAAGNPVNAIVALGMGDVNWDGVVNSADLWYYDSSNPNNCYGTSPGDPKWDLDCDMNLNNRIDLSDLIAVSSHQGNITPINTTHFAVDLNPGTYALRAKYDNQIQNNQSVVINPGQITRVDFNFLTCDGFSALNCNVPPAGSGNFRNLIGNCGRLAPTFAKIDCNGNYNSHTVCNNTVTPGPLCNNINPSVGAYSVSSTSVNIGDTFSINANGNCPNDLPGNCLVECGVIEPNNSIIYLDTWSKNSITTMPSVTCDQAGNYTVDYCLYGTDFNANRGWNSINDTNTNISCTIPVYTLTFKAQVNATGKPLSGVQVAVDGLLKTTGSDGTVTYQLTAGPHVIWSIAQFGSIMWSHYQDNDCNDTDLGWNWDLLGGYIGGWRQYSFTMYSRNRNITAQYRSFTNITDTTGNQNTFNFDGSTISGKLLDESNNAIIDHGKNYSACGPSTLSVPINRNITLEVYNSSDSKWYYIGTNDSIVDGSWSYKWSCNDPNLKNLRASYASTNWYYANTSAVINVNCVPPTYTLTFNAQADQIGKSLAGVQVSVDGKTNTTQADGTVTYQLTAGSHTLSTQTLFYSRSLSHFWDQDCDGSGNYLDTAGSPFGTYTFTMLNKDRSITAYYRTFNKIVNYTIDNFDDDNYNGWTPDCSGTNLAMVGGYNSPWALKVSPTPGSPLACAVNYSSYNAISGKKITYACDGSSGDANSCRLNVWNHSSGSCCCLNTITCNMITGQCRTGTATDCLGTFCPTSPSGWSICETNITEVPTSKAENADVYVYNNGNGYSIYDSILEAASFSYDGITVKGRLLDETDNIIRTNNGNYHPSCGPSTSPVIVNRNVTIDYYEGGNWYSIGTNDSSTADGSWSLDLPYMSIAGATKLRANYIPLPGNWYYMGASAVMDLTCEGIGEICTSMTYCQSMGGSWVAGLGCSGLTPVCCYTA